LSGTASAISFKKKSVESCPKKERKQVDLSFFLRKENNLIHDSFGN
jgi:hypothetical protein